MATLYRPSISLDNIITLAVSTHPLLLALSATLFHCLSLCVCLPPSRSLHFSDVGSEDLEDDGFGEDSLVGEGKEDAPIPPAGEFKDESQLLDD